MKWLVLVLLRLVLIHAPNGDEIEINPNEISCIREPREAGDMAFHKGVRCVLVMTNGRFIGAAEDCQTVKLMVEAAEERR